MYGYGDVKGKKVIALFEAKNLGVLDDLIVDKALQRVRFFSATQEDGSRLYFPFAAISAVTGDAVMLKNTSRVERREAIAPPLTKAPLLLPVYTHEGKFLGNVSGLSLDGDKITAIIVDDASIDTSKLLSRSDELLIVNGSDGKVKLCPPIAPSVKSAGTAEGASDPDAATTAKQSPTPVERASTSLPTAPQKASATVTLNAADENGRAIGYSFLLGRRASKKILGDDGLLIIAEGEQIDDATLERAQSSDKLVQLALHSR